MADHPLRQFLWGAVPLATLALGCMPLFPPRAMVVVIALWLAVLVVRAFIDPLPIDRARIRWCAFLALPFLLMLLDIPRAPTLAVGWMYAERSASILVFPVGFLVLAAPATKRFRDTMMDLFSLAAVALALYANTSMLLVEVPPEVLAAPGYVYSYRAMFGIVTSVHPPYAAYFFFIAALFQITRFLDRAPHGFVRCSTIATLFLAGVLLASRMPLFAFAAAASLVALLRMPRKQAVRGALGVAIALGLSVTLSAGLRERVQEVFNGPVFPSAQGEITSTNIRLPLAHCSVETIREHWLLGTGQAQAQTVLDACYRQFNIPLLLDGSYGTHDQFLHWWLCFGIAGMLLFIGYFGALLWHAWRRRNIPHLALLVFLLICMATENLLARQWGVVLFACFNALFIAGSLSETTPVRKHTL